MADDQAQDEEVIAWTAVPANLPVIASDGTEVGKVVEVAALPGEDIFHGLAIRRHRLGDAVLAPAEQVARITTRAAYLTVDPTAVDAYEPFHQLNVEHLGLRGIFNWKHLGWTKSDE